MKPDAPIKLSPMQFEAVLRGESVVNVHVEREASDDDGYAHGVTDAERATSEREIAEAAPLIVGYVDKSTRDAIRNWHRYRHLSSSKAHAVRIAPRARTSRRTRRHRCATRRTSGSRGDPGGEGDAEDLVAELDDADDRREYFDLLRAGFCVLHHWSYARFHAALDAAIVSGRAYTLDLGGEEVWICRRLG